MLHNCTTYRLEASHTTWTADPDFRDIGALDGGPQCPQSLF